MIIDTHTHTNFSTDSKMSITEAMAKADMLGIGLTITEHLDLEYLEPNAYVVDINEYLRQYRQYHSDKLLLGIEIGMRLDCLAESAKIIAEHELDFVIGSVHVIDDLDIYQAEFYKDRSKKAVYEHYFQAMFECITKFDFIDSLGHIDYIARYARFLDPEIYYSEFQEHIDQVLSSLAAKQKAIEINTRLLTNKPVVQALLPIYKRFSELGGGIATIGSDAHRPDDIGRAFNIAQEIAEFSNLKIVYYKQRKPYYC